VFGVNAQWPKRRTTLRIDPLVARFRARKKCARIIDEPAAATDGSHGFTNDPGLARITLSEF
jgi:hypothetical protein